MIYKNSFLHITTRFVVVSAILSLMLMSGCSKGSGNKFNNPLPVDTTTHNTGGGGTTKGNDNNSYLLDTLGGNGVDLQPSYYNNGNVDFGWSLMKQQAKIKCVRIEIEPSVPISEARGWIAQALSNGYKVIATYHKYTVLGSSDSSYLMDAARWWKTNYDSLAKAGPFIVNLMNEWGSGTITASAYATDYNSAIALVRNVYSGWIVIDIPGYGQETYTAYQACKTSSPNITDNKIILSTHIYPGNYNHGRGHTYQPSDLDDLSNTGRPCIVGEYGTGNGSCDWSACVDYAKTKGWPVIAWCWNGDGNDLNMVAPSWATNSAASSFTLDTYFTTVYSKL